LFVRPGYFNMEIKLEAYSGPLELLFELIKKNEIDIYDIPMAELCRQYIQALRSDMEEISEFLVMAATLLEIKSRMLLPRPTKAGEEEEEDPREALVRQLLAYKHCQDLAAKLKDTPDKGQRLFKTPEYQQVVSHSAEEWLSEVKLDELMAVFADVMQRQARKIDNVRHKFGTVDRERYSVSDKIRYIRQRLQNGRTLSLSELFEECQNRSECVATFLALLEMIRKNQAAVRQQDLFGEIEICPQ